MYIFIHTLAIITRKTKTKMSHISCLSPKRISRTFCDSNFVCISHSEISGYSSNCDDTHAHCMWHVFVSFYNIVYDLLLMSCQLLHINPTTKWYGLAEPNTAFICNMNLSYLSVKFNSWSRTSKKTASPPIRIKPQIILRLIDFLVI